jgi:TOTE conflict system, Archaeo-Eukaryotic Primase domain
MITEKPLSWLPAKITRQPPVTIDTFLTKKEFLALVEHMGNGNPVSHFLTVWRDDDGSAKFAKAKSRKRAEAQASWTWDTITGKSKRKTSMGLYPKNQDNQSTWGALDFDAHAGNDELAKNRSIRAFSLLLEYRDRYLLLSASGRGYHVFIFARELRPIAEWAHLLKDTCESVGAPIQDGVCEMFPNERTERQAVGRPIRVPGSFNPSTGEIELIIADTIRPLLDHLALREKPSKTPLLKVNSIYLDNLSEKREADNSSYSINGFFSASTERLMEGIIVKYPIKTKSTRNGVLLKLTGELFHKFGRRLSERIVRQHYDLYEKNVTTSLKEHMREFAAAWNSFLAKAVKSLSATERRIFDQLNTDPQREGFMLIRSFSHLNKGGDFPIGQSSLADRLCITQPGVRCVISKLIEVGAIEKTMDAQINNKSARYRWLPTNVRPNQ